MQQGKLIVFSAPSGSGKTSIVRYLLEKEELKLAFSISATSRKLRGTEEDGVDYYFISSKEFKKQIKEKAFVEWEEVYHNTYYGTYKKEIERIINQGNNIVFDIDVVGGVNIKKQFPKETLSIFVKPPSVEELEKRLRNRKTDSEEKIQERIAKATEELSYESEFDVVVINDNLDQAREEAYELICSFLNKKDKK
jgi:guanylate kinase